MKVHNVRMESLPYVLVTELINVIPDEYGVVVFGAGPSALGLLGSYDDDDDE